MIRKEPAIYERAGKWYAKIKYPVGHAERPGGGWRNIPTGEAHKARALLAAEEMRDRVERGLPAVDPAAGGAVALMTVRELADRFLREYTRRRIKDLARYRREAAGDFRVFIIPHLGERPAATLRRADVLAWINALRGSYSGRTINLAVARLSALYTWALNLEILSGAHPCKGIESEATAPADDHLAMAECRAVLALDPDGLADREQAVWYMVAIVLYTGLRIGEVCALRWEQVDFKSGLINVLGNWKAGRSPKSGKPRAIPIHPELRPLLLRWQRITPGCGGAVFRGARRLYNAPSKLAKILESAGAHVCRPRPWHGLRHSFSTHLTEATGGNVDLVARILGHSSTAASAVTLGYVHPGASYLVQELAKLSYGLPRDELAAARARRAG